MANPKPTTFLDKTRRDIGHKVRGLRVSRKWTQSELAKHLGLSQNRLSEIERGDGSFTAEQLLLLLRLFNVSVVHFGDHVAEPARELQNALARLGASHLHEAVDVLPREELDEIDRVVREVLIDGSPRFVTALAPVLVRHARALNLRSVQAELSRLGYERRLPWVVANILEAVNQLHGRLPKKLVLQTAALQLFVNYFGASLDKTASPPPPDVLDPSIRTVKTLEQVQRKASELSRYWGVVTALIPDDFVGPLEASLVAR